MTAFVLCAGSAATGLGLAMATWCSRPGRDVGWTVSTYPLVIAGWVFGILAIDPEPERLIMASPFGWPAVVTERLGRDTFGGLWGAAIDWTMLYAGTALALLSATLKTFNRSLGRVEGRSHPRGRAQHRAA
jgi:ABC-type Fe3+ transport system permease subunit